MIKGISKIESKRGFSLIELAVLLLVLGIFISGGLDAYKAFWHEKPRYDTEVRYELVQKSLSNFRAQKGRLPCPARPELDSDSVVVGEAKPGEEVCPTDFVTRNTAWGVIPLCNNDKTYDLDVTGGAGLCYVVGRDVDQDITVTDDVLIGSIPYLTLGIPYEESLDGWGVKIKYAVTRSLTARETYDEEGGSIYLAVPNPNTTPDDGYRPTLTSLPSESALAPTQTNALHPAPVGSAHYLLLSSGQNKVGQYIYGSDKKLKTSYPCITPSLKSDIESSPDYGLDFENCNNDEFFFSGEYFSLVHGKELVTSIFSRPLSTVRPGAFEKNRYYYDDIVHEKNKVDLSSHGKWGYTGNTVSEGSVVRAKSVRNITLGGRVGIGTEKPKTTLDVDGTAVIRKIYSDQYCDEFGGSCFSMDFFVDNKEACSGGIVFGFSQGRPICIKVSTQTFPGTFGPIDILPVGPYLDGSGSLMCPKGSYMTGVDDQTGRIICACPKGETWVGGIDPATIVMSQPNVNTLGEVCE